jgi:hypothetical protein
VIDETWEEAERLLQLLPHFQMKKEEDEGEDMDCV